VLDTVLLALAASASWGTADFAAGFMTRHVPLLTVLAVAQLLGLVAAATIVAASGAPLPATGPALASLGAGVAVIGGLACFYRGLAAGTMSIVAPIAATGVVIPVAVGVASGNRLATIQVVGMLAAVLGVALAAGAPNTSVAVPDRRAHRQGVVLALVSACAFGCYFLLAHIGARGGVPWFLLLAHITSVGGVLAMMVVARSRPRLPAAGDLGVLAVAGALDFGATALYGLANRHGQLAIVAVAGSLYPVATVLLARSFLRERLGRPHALGVALALAGVAMIAA
jgi:drug/metabolite transporter (DMT)-like permease